MIAGSRRFSPPFWKCNSAKVGLEAELETVGFSDQKAAIPTPAAANTPPHGNAKKKIPTKQRAAAKKYGVLEIVHLLSQTIAGEGAKPPQAAAGGGHFAEGAGCILSGEGMKGFDPPQGAAAHGGDPGSIPGISTLSGGLPENGGTMSAAYGEPVPAHPIGGRKREPPQFEETAGRRGGTAGEGELRKTAASARRAL